MNSPIRLEASGPYRHYPYLAFFLFGLGTAFVFLLDEKPVLEWMGFLEMAILGIGCLVAYHQNRILEGRTAVIDDVGVGAEHHGQRLWTLPWSQFGGYRRVIQSIWERIRYPERSGIEILNRDGLLVGILHVEEFRGPTDSSRRPPITKVLRKGFFRELDRRVPDGGTRPVTTVREPALKNSFAAWGGAIGGTALLLGTMTLAVLVSAAFRDGSSPSPLIEWFLHGMRVLWFLPFGFVGATVATMGWIGVASQKHPYLLAEATPRLPEPEEGPHEEDHALRLALEQPDLVLQPGIRYRVVHPEPRRKRLRTEMAAGRFLAAMFGLISLSSPLLLLDPKVALPVVAFIAVFALLFVAVGLSSARTARAMVDGLDDTVIYQEGQLIAVKPDGTYRSFQVTEWKPGKQLERLRDHRGVYLLDRASLYPCESSVQLELELD